MLMIDPVLILPISYSFAVFWALSAYHKYSANEWFQGVIKDYHLFPALSVKPLSILVPSVEMMISILLIAIPTWGTAASVFLFLAYGLLLLFNYLRGHVLSDCGCSWGGNQGTNKQSSSMKFYVYRNVALALLSAIVLLPQSSRSLMWLDWISAIMASAVLLCLAFTIINLFSNYSRMKGYGHV